VFTTQEIDYIVKTADRYAAAIINPNELTLTNTLAIINFAQAMCSSQALINIQQMHGVSLLRVSMISYVLNADSGR